MIGLPTRALNSSQASTLSQLALAQDQNQIGKIGNDPVLLIENEIVCPIALTHTSTAAQYLFPVPFHVVETVSKNSF
jgi:hypothetical protein